MIGKILGNRYELLEQLGGGGMAVVYKAMDTFLNRMVTVKILRSEYASDEAFVARFRKEAQAVARLSHPNIVNIHDVGTEGEIYYLVMEFIDGQDLKTLIRSEAPMPPEKAVPIIRQVCDALAHAHKNNIVHRDVKPHNILITTDGRAKLTDFGIAREASAATLTYTDTVMGSVHYISPEQARGEAAGPRSDIYSLGVVAYELLSGKVPFTGTTPIGVAMKHVQEDPPSLREVNPSVPAPLSATIAKALEKKADNRFQSAGDMARALETGVVEEKGNYGHIYPDEMDTRVIPNLGKKKRKINRRHIWGGIALALIGLILGTVIAFSNYINTPDIKVPDVTGKPYEEAQSILEKKGLKCEVVKEIFSDEDKGVVVSQNIGPNDPPVKPGRVIDLIVSKGPDLREVPGLIGMTESEAAGILLDNGLRLSDDIKREYSDQVEKGFIIDQSPGKGAFVKRNSTVQITVSLGAEPKLIKVPDVTNMQEEQAKAKLTENGFQLDSSITWEESAEVLYGYVIRQAPQPGEEVAEGSKVRIVLSKGPGPGTRVAEVKLEKDIIPDDGQEHKVEIIVEDAAGLHTEYANTHVYGERVVKNISYQGRAVVRVYVDGQLELEENVE